jgi:6-phosphogluconate dehydrogenase (decarboxylating)
MTTGVDYGVSKAMAEMMRVSSDVLALPFDMAREQYAKSVRAGLVERSMIASAKFEQALSALERFTLGGMARRY